ncbi:hypothetical protein QT397_10185 [Microbulbifer sp. MKSA007]|uniref:hypothetical protein n=1 Tax=Microbulbifer sp. EKSA005 TaxID=3243364 RepID=UPI002B30B273|nr:hypothetical protein QT397_10185 [Microbulbifer sp. MKSA007]
MIRVSFGVYEARISEEENRLSIVNISGEGSYISYCNLNGIEVLENTDSLIKFRKGWFTYEFSFTEFTPGLDKIKYVSKLFHKLPLLGFRGEIGYKDKGLLRNAISKYC